MSDSSESEIITEESLEGQLAEILDETARVISGRRERLGRGPKDPFTFDEDLQFALRQELQGDAIRVFPMATAEGGAIDDVEFNREIVKKALTALDSGALKRLAKTRGAAVTGRKEIVAERVARAFAWDGDEIAQVVAAYEQETETDYGHATRLFLLAEVPDVDYMRRRLSVVEGRFMKVGLAKWFGFQSVDFGPDSIVVDGTLRSYQTGVETNDGKSELSYVPAATTARVTFSRSRVVRVDSRTVAGAKSAIDALMLATNSQRLDYVPYVADVATGEAGQPLHPVTEYMLDFIYGALPQAAEGPNDPNVLHARFRVPRGSQAEAPIRRAQLKALRLEGDFILDSREACNLMVVERRPLVDVTVSFEAHASEFRYPVRITVESDHVAVATGLGAEEHWNAATVHDAVVSRLSEVMLRGPSSEEKIQALVKLMWARARDTSNEDQGTFLS